MYRVAIGGPITINSFLTEHDRNTAREHMLKTASKQMREAAKIGLQSLYADPSDVLEKYKYNTDGLRPTFNALWDTLESKLA